jgi:hypothetical protein
MTENNTLPVKLDIQTSDFADAFANAPLADKQGTVLARQVTETETIVTIVNGDFTETTNTAHAGDFVITNPNGEEYILEADNFTKRYKATGAAGVYQARGTIRFIDNPTGASIEIVAPWGAPQYGDADCLLAVSVEDENDAISADRYIIERKAFDATYKVR